MAKRKMVEMFLREHSNAVLNFKGFLFQILFCFLFSSSHYSLQLLP